MGKYLEEFVEELSSEFALDGVEILERKLENGKYSMNIKYISEVGSLVVEQDDDDDLSFTYMIKRERKEIKKGIMGAVSGAGIGGLLRGALSRRGNLSDQVAGAVGGAVAGGAYKAYEGYEESKEDRTKFAKLMAKTVEEVRKEIESKYQIITEAKLEAIAEDNEEKKALEDVFQELSLNILSLKEELAFDEIEEDMLERIKARLSRSEQLFDEAKIEYEKDNIDEAEVKATVAKNMIKKAQDLYSQV